MIGLAVGAAVVTTSALALHDERPEPRSFGTVSTPTTAPPSIDAPPSTVAPSSTPKQQETPAPEPPVRLWLPSQDVTADVLPVTVTGRELGVPDDPANVGWWSASARPGAATGSTVIDGHVDDAELGRGAFFRLGELAKGAPVYVESADGRRTAYRVVARQIYPKDRGLPADVFRLDGPHRLVLITCGGAFDGSARSYVDNIVVVAVPG